MSETSVRPLRSTDAADVSAFELENRAFFESQVNARPADYYAADGVRDAIDEALRDATADRAYQYLVHDRSGRLVGRVNLTRVRRAHFHSAELGYRIAEAAGGRGHASAAVAWIVAEAFDALGLVRLEANARSGNLGSQRVLVKNGFTAFGRSLRSFELRGVWHDRIHYERRRQ